MDIARVIVQASLGPCLHETWERGFMGMAQTTWAVHAYKLDETAQALCSVLDRTLSLGMSRSSLLIGPLHQARIAVLHALNMLDGQRDELSPSYVVVHLSGIIHGSDLLALKAIARQLKIDFECEPDPKASASFQANVEFVLHALRQGSRLNQPIIILMQDFELFAQRSKHGLLYHLLDLAHDSANQLAIIGITEHSDVVSLLETRVQSRFSNSRIFVQPRFLSLHELLLSMKYSLSIPPTYGDKFERGFVENYNIAVGDLFGDPKVQAVVKEKLDWGTPMRSFFEFLSFYVEQSEGEHIPNQVSFLKCAASFFFDPLSMTLEKLEPMDLLLLVGMWHLDRKGLRVCTFEMICNIWKDFKRTHPGILTPEVTSSCLMKAFEKLVEFNLVVVEGALTGCMQPDKLKRFQNVFLKHDVDDLRQRIRLLKHSFPAWLIEWIDTDGIVR